MINTVLNILREELLNNNIDSDIVIDNIAKEDSDSSTISDKIVITLLSVEEEKTLKNYPRYERVEDPERYIKKNLPAYLNLYVMISGNRDSYDKSLKGISKVIEIFQTRKEALAQEQKFRMQLHSLPFDQLSYAWGLLGGKVLPSVLYKISIIKIQHEGGSKVGLIKNVDIQSKKNY